MSPLIVILSSPSGVGKTSIARRLVSARDDVGYAISATTRPPRPLEKEGVDYYFLDSAEFDQRVGVGEFAEWAEYGGAKYGTLRSELDRIRNAGRHAILDIEVQGARSIRESYAEAVSIFLLPPSVDALLDRLRNRKTEGAESVTRRLAHAVDELDEAPSYDFVVVNDELDAAVADVSGIIDAAARSPGRNAAVGRSIEVLSKDLLKAREQLGH